LQVRVLPPQPASPVSVGHVPAERIVPSFPRLNDMPRRLWSAIFWIFCRSQRISEGSLWWHIFNFRVVAPETRFDATGDGFDTCLSGVCSRGQSSNSCRACACRRGTRRPGQPSTALVNACACNVYCTALTRLTSRRSMPCTHVIFRLTRRRVVSSAFQLGTVRRGDRLRRRGLIAPDFRVVVAYMLAFSVTATSVYGRDPRDPPLGRQRFAH
jgi:hypothetical protein